jgi:cold shock CspA family protein
MTDNKQLAVVERYYVGRGYGFLRPLEAEGPDLYFHVAKLREAGMLRLKPGDRVRHGVHTYRGRPEACDLEMAA